jgi:hypothetical protein
MDCFKKNSIIYFILSNCYRLTPNKHKRFWHRVNPVQDTLPFKIDRTTLEPHTKRFFIDDEKEFFDGGWSAVGRGRLK